MTAHSAEFAKRNRGLQLALKAMPRGEFFAGLYILGCVNGLAGRVIDTVNRLGWTDALIGTFHISAIVWISCFAGVAFILSDKADVIRSPDIAVGFAFLLLVPLPIDKLSWFAVALLSLYILLFAKGSGLHRKGAIILLATTVPMLWSWLFIQFFANLILEIDASFVGWLLGTQRIGNLVEFADNSGKLVILPSCTSLANMSLAFLCWITISQSVSHRWSSEDLFWTFLACVSVVTVNVTRISLMGLSHSYYDAMHSEWGGAVFNTITLSVMVGISLVGVRRELLSRA